MTTIIRPQESYNSYRNYGEQVAYIPLVLLLGMCSVCAAMASELVRAELIHSKAAQPCYVAIAEVAL